MSFEKVYMGQLGFSLPLVLPMAFTRGDRLSGLASAYLPGLFIGQTLFSHSNADDEEDAA